MDPSLIKRSPDEIKGLIHQIATSLDATERSHPVAYLHGARAVLKWLFFTSAQHPLAEAEVYIPPKVIDGRDPSDGFSRNGHD